ncbi:hypothetical protein HD806DRAFT_509510 [Xylariaceae sp. AK1471]|nr:hypothetical protein HD806DRAFT_509510 [Xylariaceae sp. AK1471]
MDWLQSDNAVWDKNMNILDFEPAKSKVLAVEKETRTPIRAQEYSLQSDEDWQDWLNQKFQQLDHYNTSKVNLILGARAETEDFDPAILSCMPFSESTFQTLVKEFKVHGTIARTINRSTSCAFIRKFCSWDLPLEQTIVYNCRSAAAWHGDLALSVTFSPHNLTSHAIMYGCDKKTTEDVIRRLSNSDLLEFHPMVLVVLFAELERDRLDRLVRNKISQLIQRIISITETTNYTLDSNDSSPLSPSLATSIKDWLEMGDLRNGLQAFKRKMQDMMEHVDELQDTLLNPDDDENNFAAKLDPKRLRDFRDTGMKIKERLKHLVDEFDEHIRKCATIIDGVGLASQLEWNQIGRKDTFTNLEIAHNGLKVAQHTRRDSELMKSIALLTMIFIPATFVATLFSMGIFEWKGANGEILSVSPYIWLYVVLTVVITSLTLGIWYVWATQRRAVGDVESQPQSQEPSIREKGTFRSSSNSSSNSS